MLERNQASRQPMNTILCWKGQTTYYSLAMSSGASKLPRGIVEGNCTCYLSVDGERVYCFSPQVSMQQKSHIAPCFYSMGKKCSPGCPWGVTNHEHKIAPSLILLFQFVFIILQPAAGHMHWNTTHTCPNQHDQLVLVPRSAENVYLKSFEYSKHSL